MLSRLTISYGSEYMLFVDQCYLQEGYIVTIHRRLLPLHELLVSVAKFHRQHPFLRPNIAAPVSHTTSAVKNDKKSNNYNKSGSGGGTKISASKVTVNSPAVTSTQQL
uniref:Protein sip5 n=1 Tax=Lygus hesperus TaxID=30085 RepID=A0A0A9XSU7_LYGHE